MKVVAVIPARYASSRFPGKPLTDIRGKPMIERVCEQVLACKGIDRVIVATDDSRIYDTVTGFGVQAVMSNNAYTSGTDRVAHTVRDMAEEIVINIQGDQVVFDPLSVTCMIDALGSGDDMATIAVPVDKGDMENPNCVKVVCDSRGYALYFSRSPIPYARVHGNHTGLKHVGIYGFRRKALLRFAALPPAALEQTESLEQLRALENNIPIQVIISSGRFYEINVPEDKEGL